jgi:hypothetical protein
MGAGIVCLQLQDQCVVVRVGREEEGIQQVAGVKYDFMEFLLRVGKNREFFLGSWMNSDAIHEAKQDERRK